MNTQLMKCFFWVKSFPLKEANFCLDFLILKTAQYVKKQPEFQNLKKDKLTAVQECTILCSA